MSDYKPPRQDPGAHPGYKPQDPHKSMPTGEHHEHDRFARERHGAPDPKVVRK